MARGGRPGKKRTQYVRDASGRFASTPGGKKATPAAIRKAAKAAAVKGGTLQSRTSLKRSRAKLAAIDKADETLQTSLSKRAQKGAVTRGKKKLVQAIKSSQVKLSVAPKSSIIKKKQKTSQPTAQPVKSETPKAVKQKIRTGEFVRANLRPRNVMAKPVKGENPFKNANQFPINERRKIALQNIEIAKSWLGSKGITATVYDGNKTTYARSLGGKKVELNRNSSIWMNPSGRKRDERRSGFKSSSSPVHTLWHEIGHEKDKRFPFRWQEAVNYSTTNAGRERRYKSFVTAANPTLSKAARKRRGKEIEALARRVSSYATTDPSEFVAETYAGRRTGRKYDYQVMSAYRETKGLNPNPIVRKLKKKGKTKPNP